MKSMHVKNLGLAVIIAASVSACNDSATNTSGKDSLSASSTDNATPTTTTPADNTTTNTEPQSDDAKLVSELVESMYSGIAVMQQGQTKATSPSVKALAKKLETEHTKLTEDLKALAAKKGWTMPTCENADDAKKREDLAKETGAEYDKDWLEALKDRHETNIKKLEDSKTTDPDLKAAAAKGLPKLHELLGNIEVVQKGLK